MSVIPDKKDYKNVKQPLPEQFVSVLKKGGYELISTVKATDKSHFDRYGLLKDGKRVIIVYDVVAEMLSVTAFENHFRAICDTFERVRGGKVTHADGNKSKMPDNRRATAENNNAERHESQKTPVKANKMPENNAGRDIAKSGHESQTSGSEKNLNLTKINRKNDTKNPTASHDKKVGAPDVDVQNDKAVSGKTEQNAKIMQIKGEPKPVSSQPAKPVKSEKKTSKPAATDEHKNDANKQDFTLKNYSPERFDIAIAAVKSGKIKVRKKGMQGSGIQSVTVYELSDGNNKITVCYMPNKKILQIQGKQSEFHLKVQTYFSEEVDFKSAVKAHVEQKQTDKSAGEVEKLLKKYLPVGVMVLSSQAKIDFSIGIVDLLSGNIVLSDYSSLLIPPYRGLEKMIFDLQKAQGIKVKMIGQAYEKNEYGQYVLKAIYRKRIGSIVFAEVMAALYTEYNSTRNFYVHSSVGAQTKVIADKNQAIAIYEKMLAVVEYNAKKLKEISYTLQLQ